MMELKLSPAEAKSLYDRKIADYHKINDSLTELRKNRLFKKEMSKLFKNRITWTSIRRYGDFLHSSYGKLSCDVNKLMIDSFGNVIFDEIHLYDSAKFLSHDVKLATIIYNDGMAVSEGIVRAYGINFTENGNFYIANRVGYNIHDTYTLHDILIENDLPMSSNYYEWTNEEATYLRMVL